MQPVLAWTKEQVFPGNVFIENKGIFPAEHEKLGKIRYGILGTNTVVIGEKGILIRMADPRSLTRSEEENEEENKPIGFRDVFFTWENANINCQVAAKEKTESYFTAVVMTNGKPEAAVMHGFKNITFEELYPGIDLELITDGFKTGFEYRLILKPGSDVSKAIFKYSGAVKSAKIENNNLHIRTPFGTIEESGLKAFDANRKVIPVNYRLSGNQFSFEIPKHSNEQMIIIDPWVSTGLTSLNTNNKGYDVDFDYSGNLYVYGGGGPAGTDPFKVSKFNTTGSLQWTFLGVVASASWNSLGFGLTNYPGNFIVDKQSGKTYVGQGNNNNGTQIVRLTTAGLYDNFISAANPSFRETWDMSYNCVNGTIYAYGGGTTSSINFGVVNTSSGAVSSSNITGNLSRFAQDIVNAAADFSGNIFVLFACIDTSIGNHIYRLNAAHNGNSWSRATGFTTINEAMNKPHIPMMSNGANVLAVNENYLFYYDGKNLKAFDKNTGAGVGTPLSLTGTALMQCGVAADNCNNVYVGRTGSIDAYQFNGSSFVFKSSISCGAAGSVYDIRYNNINNTLYAAGADFCGVYSATESVICNTLNVVATSSCTGVSNATVNTNLTGYTFEYNWYNSTGTLIRSFTSGSLQDSITNLSPGTYYVHVQATGNCGGPLAIDTITVLPGTTITYNLSSTIALCDPPNSGTATVNAVTGGTPPYSYSWNTIPVQTGTTATGLLPGNYTCTVTDANGCTSVSTVLVGSSSTISLTSTQSNVSCNGANNGSANVSASGGNGTLSYSWQPGGQTSPAISNLSAGTYICTVSDANNCMNVISVTITEPPAVTVSATISRPVICSGDTVTLSATGAQTYSWSTGITGSSTTLSPIQSGTYTVVGSDAGGCTGSATVQVTAYPYPQVSFNGDSVCLGNRLNFLNTSTINAPGTITSYQWDFGDGTNVSAVNPGHTYATAGSYNVTLTATGTNNCISSVTRPVNVYQQPVAMLTADITSGCPPLPVHFFNLSSSVDPITSFQWTFGNGETSSSSTPVTTYLQSGSFNVSLTTTTIRGCADDTTMQFYINVFNAPSAGFAFEPNNITIMQPRVNFTDLSSGASLWYWDFGDSTFSTLNEPSHTFTEAGQYAVTQIVTNQAGCRDTAVSVLEIGNDYALYIPNSFSPNGDGVNEIFNVKGFNIRDFSLSIFNRWGMLIYETQDLEKGWDGMYRGGPAQETVYNYLVTFTDVFNESHRIKGRVSLIR